jgi:hypothetical protein
MAKEYTKNLSLRSEICHKFTVSTITFLGLILDSGLPELGKTCEICGGKEI